MDNKQVTESIIKAVFASIPFAGQPLNELFYDFRGRVKQQRINDFTELLKQYFDGQTAVNYNELNIVEFSDLFESVILKVAHTGSKEKHKRFKEIIIGYLETPNPVMDHSDTFLELVNVLNDHSIQILRHHYLFDVEFQKVEEQLNRNSSEIARTSDELESERKTKELGYANNYITIVEKMELLNKTKTEIETELKVIGKYRTSEFYGLSIDDFLYLKQILASRALMTDLGVGSISHIPFCYMGITVFGRHFIDYIRGGRQ